MAAKLTYLFLITLLMGIVSSCSSDDSRELGFGQSAEMVFDVPVKTRASVTTTSDINTPGSKFAVFGDMKTRENGAKDPLVVLDKTAVEYENGGWSYEGTRYWFPNCEHSFVAIHPSSACGEDNARYSGSELAFTYEMPVGEENSIKKDEIKDVIAATHRRLRLEDDLTNTVSFRFGHLLALVNIAPAFDDDLKNETDYVEFQKLEFSGFKTKATFSILPSSLQSDNQTDGREIAVAGQEGVGDMTVEFASPVKVENNRENFKLFADNDAILMLPQTFDADSEAKIVMTYTIGNDATQTRQAILPLRNVVWVSGKSYTYRFTLKRTDLVVESTVITDWDKLDAGNFDAR